ncbi:MAG: hypothetical protein BRD55_03555 [Bacteroidetes bacterium SW_9_63_38]|nr:MAG: hypothetical protein BRD55_03555 [Bacteroidetes bacterium SW_9_63_38]
MPASSLPPDKTKGQIEAGVTEATTQYERDYLGRGPKEAKSFIVENLVIVKLQGILSPAERQLSHENGGVGLIKKMRIRLIESSSEDLCDLVTEETGTDAVSMHTDISSRTGKRIFVFSMDADLQNLLEER